MTLPVDMRQVIAVAKALSDLNRLRILLALRGRELCVCQLVELLELAPSTVSKHMAVLRQALLVDCRKDGRWVHYRRAGKDAPDSVRAALRWVDGALLNSPDARDDAGRLETILKVPLEEVCGRSTDRSR